MLWKWNGWGQKFAVSDCALVISAVSTMNTNGAMNTTASTISTLWSAIATNNRLRRTAQGTFLRTIGTGSCSTAVAIYRTPPWAWTHRLALRRTISVTASDTTRSSIDRAA